MNVCQIIDCYNWINYLVSVVFFNLIKGACSSAFSWVLFYCNNFLITEYALLGVAVGNHQTAINI